MFHQQRSNVPARELFIGAVAGITAGFSELTLGTFPAVLFALVGFVLLTELAVSRAGWRSFVLAGFVFALIGSSWVASALDRIHGFHLGTVLAVMVLFWLGGALLFFLFWWLVQMIREPLERYGLTTACAWVTIETLAPQVFPWTFSQAFVSIPEILHLNSFGGTKLWTFLLFWFCESLLLAVSERRLAKPLLVSSVVLLLSIGVSAVSLIVLDRLVAERGDQKWKVVLFQPNYPIETEATREDIRQRQLRLKYESRSFHERNTLIVWPEQSLGVSLPSRMRFAVEPLPFASPQQGAVYLLGVTTAWKNRSVHNSAIGINPGGHVAGLYHKRRLVPFGEYSPIGSLFGIRPVAGAYHPGEDPTVIPLTSVQGRTIRVAPLICYEDLFPYLAREQVVKGAEVIALLSNDIWFQDSKALELHLLESRARAAETGRYVLRATNSGVTAIIHPNGNVERQIAGGERGTLIGSVTPLQHKNLFVRGGYLFPYLISAVTILLTLLSLFRTRLGYSGL